MKSTWLSNVKVYLSIDLSVFSTQDLMLTPLFCFVYKHEKKILIPQTFPAIFQFCKITNRKFRWVQRTVYKFSIEINVELKLVQMAILAYQQKIQGGGSLPPTDKSVEHMMQNRLSRSFNLRAKMLNHSRVITQGLI